MKRFRVIYGKHTFVTTMKSRFMKVLFGTFPQYRDYFSNKFNLSLILIEPNGSSYIEVEQLQDD